MTPEKTGRVFWNDGSKGFYLENLHKEIPPNSVEITHEEWRAVLEEHATTGKKITTGKDGKPVAVDRAISAVDRRRLIRQEIADLNNQSVEFMRGTILGEAGARASLEAIHSKVAALRALLMPVSVGENGGGT